MRHSNNAAIAIVLVMLPFAVAAGEELPQAPPAEQSQTADCQKRAGALFQDYVARKKIAGAVAVVLQNGKVVLTSAVGKQDVEAGIPMSPNTIFRIASMTKPITSSAVMMLVDQGRIDLSDPVSRYLPEFKFMMVATPKHKDDAAKKSGDSSKEDAAKKTSVSSKEDAAKKSGVASKDDAAKKSGSSSTDFELVPAYRPITIRDLLMHTSGLCYRFRNHPLVGRLYAEAGICDGLAPSAHSLAENVRRLARLPLAHQPGTAWEYGLNTDVLGRLVEVVSGQSLDAFFADRIFTPLAMPDTYFVLPESKRGRLAALYEHGSDGTIVRADDGVNAKGPLTYAPSLAYQGTPGYFSGGAGLVATANDYARFLQMISNRGELEGARILRPETVDAMTRDQTSGLSLGIAVHGLGFGYGFGINSLGRADAKKDPAGTFGWGGAYYTDFWVDREHKLVGVFMCQLDPSIRLELRDQFHRLVNESIASRDRVADADRH
jgi:CubicO group peptidase (beta-lactamase class C family)